MPKIEEELKKYIIENYGNVRKFIQNARIPYSTMSSIFERGVNNSTISNIIKVCKELNISVDGLADGFIIARSDNMTNSESALIDSFRTLNEEGQEKLSDYAADLVITGRYKKIDSYRMVEKEA